MWDDDMDSVPAAPPPASTGSGRGVAVMQNGICIGRGRGFGNMASLKSSLPEPGMKNEYNNAPPADNSGWQDDSGWDESGSTAANNANTSSWQDNYRSSSQSYGGGSGSNNRNYQENGYGSSNRACFKCNQEGHLSRNCPSNMADRYSSPYRGGGGGGGRACHKCGEEGHMARECPSGGGSSGGFGGGGRTCHKCNQEGHMARDCPSGGSSYSRGGGGGRTCNKCGEEGHFARECPSGGGGGGGGFGGGSRACHKCGEEGHMARDCTSSGGGGGGRACHKCGEEGHMARDCTSSGGGGRGGGRACHKCGEEGHMARDCTSSGGGGGGGSSSSGCRNCGQDGHFAKDCPNPRLGPDGKPRAPLYIPPDLADDVNSLFQSVATGINFSKYDSIPVDITGRDVPPPINSFESANLSNHLIGNIKKAGYEVPTPVQKYAIPVIMQKRDLMACAETGSGKTAAFLLPIINSMITDPQLPNPSNKEEQEPLAVILSPTRELAIQIMMETKKFAYDSVVKADVVYGGTSTAHQSSRIRRGIHILVATPGRLLDFVEKGKVSLANVKYFVLDEADRMLDMGFMPSVENMVNRMPPKGVRQTLMFSATFAEEIQKIAGQFLDDYLFLTVGTVGGANSDVKQTFFKVGQFEKREKLMEILQESGTDRVLVFVEQKRTADFLASFTSQRNIPTTSIHGDRLQKEREEALMDFRMGRMPVLVATAVAARGLDIKDVRHVINYDLPQSIDEYVHRIGRTGRVGNLGRATSFYDPDSDQALVRSLKKILVDANQEIPDWLHEEANSAVGTAPQYNRGNFGGRDFRNQGGRGRGGQSSNDAWDDGGASSQSNNMNNYSQAVVSDEVWD